MPSRFHSKWREKEITRGEYTQFPSRRQVFLSTENLPFDIIGKASCAWLSAAWFFAKGYPSYLCGITGYVGPRPGVRTVIDMLRRLEYRGYDSAGVAVASAAENGDSDVEVIKAAGKLAVLESQLHDHWEKKGTAIAHTRWATHGGPTTPNAHPHFSNDGKIALIHNGIIENYQELKESLLAEGFHFTSDTDTEAMVHLVDRAFRRSGNMEQAIRDALSEVTGAYSIAVVSTHDPETLFAAKTASPLVLGIGNGENFLASDIPAPDALHQARSCFRGR